MDITLDVEDYKLNIRAAGVIIHNGKILAHRNINSDHYALVGGRVQIGENSAKTVKREMQEELGKNIEYNRHHHYIYSSSPVSGSRLHPAPPPHKNLLWEEHGSLPE